MDCCVYWNRFVVTILIGQTEVKYYNIVIDFATNHQFNLKNGINFFKEDAGDITHSTYNDFIIS
jgi:hypothetical protein